MFHWSIAKLNHHFGQFISKPSSFSTPKNMQKPSKTQLRFFAGTLKNHNVIKFAKFGY